MKRLRAHFDVEENPFGSPYDLFVVDGSLPRGSIRDVRLRPDGTVVELCHFESVPTDVASRVADSDDVVDFDVETTPDGGAVCHLHVTPSDAVRRLLELVDEHDLLLDTPVRLRGDGLTVDVLGDHEHLRAAVSSLPDSLADAFCVEGLSEYAPAATGVAAGLTDRQRAALAAAVELGYYDVPRSATIEDVAAELDCAPSTASEHLRKAASRVLHRVV